MSITPERQAQIDAMMEEICGPMPMPKPKAVVVENKVVRDADVTVSKQDKNYPASGSGVVQVRRADWVTVNMAAYEEQQRWKAEERQRRMHGPNYVADREARKKLDQDRLPG
jgi:hypothetical protein